MLTIKTSNVNTLYPIGIMHLKADGVRQESQHGVTLEYPEPVSVMYKNPRERILFDETRDSNPFLNFFEALWILEGRNDVDFLQYLVPTMNKYSDNGNTYYGAYGYRLRQVTNVLGNNVDQVQEAIAKLKENPDDRQVVLTIRDRMDMWYKGKDQPCNLMVSCKVRNGALNIHVFNRSNDFVWGLAGTNVVQFSMLQEYMAGQIGVKVGMYHQTTDSFHAYLNDQWDKVKDTPCLVIHDPYAQGIVTPYDMMQDADNWDKDLNMFFTLYDDEAESVKQHFETPFFCDVVEPMWEAFLLYDKFRKTRDQKDLRLAILQCKYVMAEDWSYAASMWLSRRVVK